MSWTPRPGMPPSPNELRVLYALARERQVRGTWGVRVRHVHGRLLLIAERGDMHNGRTDAVAVRFQPSDSTVRDHIRRLVQKELVVANKRPHFIWYAPTDAGYLALFRCLHPELAYGPCR